MLRLSLDAPFAGLPVLVTGGLGFIGSNLALRLALAGAEVTVVDASHARHGANPRNLETHVETARPITVIDADLAEPAVREAAADVAVVFNLAGQVSHVDSMANPLFDLDVNTRSHLGFLEGLRSNNPDAFIVYTSTRQLFGKPRYLPVDEGHPVDPVDVNGITKYASEQFHLLYARNYGLRASVLRLTNVFGPRLRLRDDFQGFLPIFIRKALVDETIEVFGAGQQHRDCLYVDDVVDCLMRVPFAVDSPGEVFNIGNDEHLSVHDIAATIVEVAGSGRVASIPWPDDRDAIDIGSYFSDSSKAKRILDWTPHTPFREGIERTIDFYRPRLEWYL